MSEELSHPDDFLLNFLNLCPQIDEQLDKVDQINGQIKDSDLPPLIQKACQLNAILNNNHIPKRQAYENLLEESDKLQFILDLSDKLEKCALDPSRLEESVDLLELIQNLHNEFGHRVSIIDSIYNETDVWRKKIVDKLCQKLDQFGQTKSPDSNAIVTTVRQLARCGIFSDRDLKLKYLQSRDSWFNNACEEKSSSFDDVVSIHCNALPMIFQEYKGLFSENSDSNTPSNVIKHNVLMQASDRNKEDGAIINSWLLLKATIFVSSLEVYLKFIKESGIQTPTMVADTIKRCFELTTWLSSIGFDFSSSLRPIFCKSIFEQFKEGVVKATENFEASFTALVSKSVESLLLPVDDEILRISSIRTEERPPKSIDHYPIFKVYSLHIFHSLRWFQTTKAIISPISLCMDTYQTLNASLSRVIKALAVIMSMDSNARHPILTNIAICLLTQILPFIQAYCDSIFPQKIVLNAIGMSVTEYKAMVASDSADQVRNLRLDFRFIAKPLQTIFPNLLSNLEL